MYRVSDAYKEAVRKQYRRYYVDGKIVLPNKKEIVLQDEDIRQGSLTINNQCVNNQELEFGAVYAGEMSLTVRSNIDRYSLYDAKVCLTFHLETGAGVYETVPFGVYTVSEATRSFQYISLKALDNMVLLDQNIELDGLSMNGMPFELLTFACTKVGVEFGMSQEEVELLPNGKEVMSFSSASKVGTYRDLLSFVAQLLCCFVTVDENGRILLKKFYCSAVSTVGDTFRTTSEFADFEVYYTSIKAAAGKEVVMAEAEENTGLQMVIDGNPFLQNGLRDRKERIINAVLAEAAGIRYVPATVSTYGDPSLQPGDMIRFTGGTAGEGTNTLITHVAYSYRGKHELKGVGKNPRLASAKTKVDKSLSDIAQGVEARDVIFYSFTNASAYNIKQARTLIVSMDFVTVAEGTIEFKATVILSSKTAATGGSTAVKVVYMLDSQEITTYYPAETYIDGNHYLFLYYLVSSEANKARRMEVYLEASGGTATIGQGQILANISGQGLAAEMNEWDGRLEFKEEFRRIEFPASEFTVRTFTDDVSITFPSQKTPDFSDTFGRITFGQQTFTVRALTENLVSEVTIKSFTLDTARPGDYDDRYVLVDDDSRFVLNQAYTFQSVEKSINQGRMCEVVMNTEPFETVTGIEVV